MKPKCRPSRGNPKRAANLMSRSICGSESRK
nr:MAG TPA: hypothetical protein [Caudoviricetes sp.]